jgi:hypothetical protein
MIPGAGNPSPSGNPSTGSNPTPVADPLHFALLLGAVSIWVLSVFFVGEAGKIAAWAARDDPSAPSSGSGVLLSQLCSVAVIFIWFFYALIIDVLEFDRAGEPMPIRILMIALHRPIRYVPGFVVASILPAVVAMVKWSQAFVTSGGGANTWKIVAVQMATYLLSMAASILVLFKNLRP